MTEYSFKEDQKSITFVINQLSHNPKLSGWEKGFINDIKDYYERGGFLSDRQTQLLSDMWEKY